MLLVVVCYFVPAWILFTRLVTEGRFSYIVAVTDVLSRIINSIPTGFITQSLYYPQIIHIITDNITATIIHHCDTVLFCSSIGRHHGVYSWGKKHETVISVLSRQLRIV